MQEMVNIYVYGKRSIPYLAISHHDRWSMPDIS